MSNEWNLNFPTDDELVADLPGEHRERKTNVAAVLEKEHATLGGSNSGGEHLPGSAVAWYLATGSIPALDVEGNALASTDNGRLWLDSTTKIFYALDDYSDPTVAGGWLAMGHLLGDIAINTNKFTVARATGNTVVVGTLDVAGNIDPTTFETTNGGFLDEDNMASNSANKVASQQSIKAHVVAAIAAIAFGTRTANDSEASALAVTEIYKAGSDGFVTFNTLGGGATRIVQLKSDSSATPSTVIFHIHGDWGAGSQYGCVPIKKNDYWQITAAVDATVENVKWLPMGSGTCVKQ